MMKTENFRGKPIPKDKKEKPGSSLFFNPVVFTIISCCSIICYTGQISYLGASVSMIEKRFQMRSTQSSLLFTINDVVGLCSVLFVAHFGEKGHRPRILGILYLLFGIGVLITALPHFIYELPISLRLGVQTDLGGGMKGGDGDYLMCDSDHVPMNMTCNAEESSQSGVLIHEAWWLFLGQALAGLVAGTMPLTITFLDDNQNRKNTPVYVGALFSSWTIGVVVGFFLANFCLRLPVNFPKADPESTVMDPRDPQFLGAWWLGMVICGTCLIICCLPLYFFPRHLHEKRRQPDEEAEAVTQQENFAGSRTNGFEEVSKSTGLQAFCDLLQSMKRIVTNVAVITAVFTSGLSIIVFVGIRTFGAKYISTQFDKSVSEASMLIGIIMVPVAALGNVASGVVVKKLRLQLRGLAMMLIVLATIGLLTTPLFFFVGCPQNLKAGLTIPYKAYNERFPVNRFLPGLSSTCNDGCNCPTIYRPVCGSDGVTYASPCHAGCSEEAVIFTSDGDSSYNQTGFTNCSCLATTNDPAHPSLAFQGECKRDCSVLFHVIFAIVGALGGALSITPSVMIKLRCVEDRDRSLVLGFTNVMLKLLGYIPGPVIWGAIVDRTCVLFQESCGKTGNCLVYNTDKFRTVFYGTALSLKLMEVVGLYIVLTAVTYRLRKAKEYNALPVAGTSDHTHTQVYTHRERERETSITEGRRSNADMKGEWEM